MTLALTRWMQAAALGLLFGGCALLPRQDPMSRNSAAEWASVLAQADQLMNGGQYAAADRMLHEFEQAHPGTPEAPEAMFYRALYKLDPANPATSPREAGALLERFVALRIVSPHRVDALSLRRVAAALVARPDAVTIAVPREGGASGAQPRADTSARDEEIARLRDELAKANAELERIRRRLATPKP